MPQEYDGPPDRYPVVVKPRCGEQFGLKSWERYTIAEGQAAYQRAYETMSQYGGAPIVQEKVSGPGEGATFFWIKTAVWCVPSATDGCGNTL